MLAVECKGEKAATISAEGRAGAEMPYSSMSCKAAPAAAAEVA